MSIPASSPCHCHRRQRAQTGKACYSSCIIGVVGKCATVITPLVAFAHVSCTVISSDQVGTSCIPSLMDPISLGMHCDTCLSSQHTTSRIRLTTAAQTLRMPCASSGRCVAAISRCFHAQSALVTLFSYMLHIEADPIHILEGSKQIA